MGLSLSVDLKKILEIVRTFKMMVDYLKFNEKDSFKLFV
jgi:hypothetical protein